MKTLEQVIEDKLEHIKMTLPIDGVSLEHQAKLLAQAIREEFEVREKIHDPFKGGIQWPKQEPFKVAPFTLPTDKAGEKE